MLYGNGIHDDTAAIQELLDKRGVVTIDQPGTYLISRTLIIHSNTKFVLSPGARILAAPNSRCTLIQNEALLSLGKTRDENIEIVGGIWDANCDEQGLDYAYEADHRLDDPFSLDIFKGKAIRFGFIDRIVLQQMTVRNPVSYGIQIGAVRGFVVRDIFFDYNWHFQTTDGVHINGPAYDGVIENLAGTTNDDLVSLTTYDEPHAEFSLGPIENIAIHNLCGRNAYSGIRLLSGEDCPLRGIHISGLYGTYRHHGIVINNNNNRPGKNWFDQIVIENVFACKSDTPLGPDCALYWENNADRAAFLYFGVDAVCGNITVRNVHRHQEISTESPLFRFDETCVIDRLVLDNIYQSLGEGATAPLWRDKGATLKCVIETNSVTSTVDKTIIG